MWAIIWIINIIWLSTLTDDASFSSRYVWGNWVWGSPISAQCSCVDKWIYRVIRWQGKDSVYTAIFLDICGIRYCNGKVSLILEVSVQRLSVFDSRTRIISQNGFISTVQIWSLWGLAKGSQGLPSTIWITWRNTIMSV